MTTRADTAPPAVVAATGAIEAVWEPSAGARKFRLRPASGLLVLGVVSSFTASS
jgi:hypothetical protein